MKRIKRRIGRILYFFGRCMPESYARINLGQRRFRAMCGRLILESCGKDVNIEKGAIFASSVNLVIVPVLESILESPVAVRLDQTL